MKKIVLAALAGILFSCNSNGYKISGEIKGVADGTKVFLEKRELSLGVTHIDTAKVENGKFTFEGKTDEPEVHGIRFENVKGGFPVILEDGDIDITVNKDSLSKTKISGTYNNDELMKYNAEINKIQKKLDAFQGNNLATMKAAQQKKDTATINRLKNEYIGITKEFAVKNEEYIQNSPKSFLSVLLIEGMFNQAEPQVEKIKKYYDSLADEVKKTSPGKKIKEKLEKLKTVEIGQKAPEFSGPTPDGKTISLKQSLGKVTIVDFWASWCAPCRKENPNVVALYNEFHSKGLNIIGVSLDKEAAKWKEAIEKDKLTWNHVSNLKFWDEPVAKQYDVQSIPATFILDQNGIIVAKDLSGAELKAKIADLLAK